MSANNTGNIDEIEIPEDTPITLRMLEAYGNIMMQEIKKDNKQLYESVAAEKKEMRQDSADLKLQFQHLLNALQGNVVQGPPEQNQPQQPQARNQAQAQESRRLSLGDIAGQIKEIISAAKEAGIMKSDLNSPIDERYQVGLQNNLNKLYNQSLKVAWNASENVLRKEIHSITKGVTRNIANELITGSGGADHEPIL